MKVTKGGTVSKLLAGVEIPRMFHAKQTFPRESISAEQIPGVVEEQIAQPQFSEKIKPGMNIAIAAGSRGIRNVDIITKAVVDAAKRCGANPFIVPAMGSHGGATEDYEFMHACPQETTSIDPRLRVQPFEVDGFFADDAPVTPGEVSVRTLLTPGHTCGCTSFFWDVENPADGARYTVGMHGGVGVNTMNDAYYATSSYLTSALRDRFIADAERLMDLRVDIALPSHPNQIEILDRAGTYTDAAQPYFDATVWPDFLRERIRQVRDGSVG